MNLRESQGEEVKSAGGRKGVQNGVHKSPCMLENSQFKCFPSADVETLPCHWRTQVFC